jgi:hypothetical protein
LLKGFFCAAALPEASFDDLVSQVDALKGKPHLLVFLLSLSTNSIHSGFQLKRKSYPFSTSVTCKLSGMKPPNLRSNWARPGCSTLGR